LISASNPEGSSSSVDLGVEAIGHAVEHESDIDVTVMALFYWTVLQGIEKPFYVYTGCSPNAGCGKKEIPSSIGSKRR